VEGGVEGVLSLSLSLGDVAAVRDLCSLALVYGVADRAG